MKKINTLSVVISAYNEELRLERTLESVKFADEIIVVNSSSTDKTSDIAKKYTKKVYIRENYTMLNKNKNFGFTKASGDWILSLDADEVIPQALAREIKDKIKETSVQGYWIPRKNIIFGKWIQHSLWWPDYQLRLFKNGAGKFPELHVHEMVTVTGKTENLGNPMEHDNYTSISQYLHKMDSIYTESEVENLIMLGKKLTWVDAIGMPASDFLKTFFSQKGYKDGLHGLVLSILQAFYAEVVFAKLWERQGFIQHNEKKFVFAVYQEFKKIAKEFNYWFYSSFIDESSNKFKRLGFKIRRKFS